MKLLTRVLCMWAVGALGAPYLPDWDSLDSRPIPGWFDDAKFGILYHWGVFSVPSFGQELFWRNLKGRKQTSAENKYKAFMDENYPPGFEYKDFAPNFKAEFYYPKTLVDLSVVIGAKYVLLNGKHHDGYTMWPSKHSPGWNSMEVGPKRDLLGEFFEAARQKSELKVGFYHSLSEWFHPAWLKDKANNFTTQEFAMKKVLPKMKELVERFKPDVFWSDGHRNAAPGYWNATSFLAWLYNESPVREKVVTNNFWSEKDVGKFKGGFLTHLRSPSEYVGRKWELYLKMDTKSGGFRREASLEDILTSQQIIDTLIQTVSTGGNLLLVVGLSEEGVVRPFYEETLRELGVWLKVNGEAIYGSTPAKFPTEMDNRTAVCYTEKDSFHYAIVLRKPRKNILHLQRPVLRENATISLLGYDGQIKWQEAKTGLRVTLPEAFRCTAPQPWVLKLTGVIDENEKKNEKKRQSK